MIQFLFLGSRYNLAMLSRDLHDGVDFAWALDLRYCTYPLSPYPILLESCRHANKNLIQPAIHRKKTWSISVPQLPVSFKPTQRKSPIK